MKISSASAVALAAMSLMAEPSGDRPNATHAWAVHDVNRPDPARVEVGADGIPSDAVVLFDGSEASVANNWRSVDGGASKWKVVDGAFVCSSGSGSACTSKKFSDCQLHLEFMTPKDDLYGWGNSGVIFMGEYEIQILDSSDVKPSKSPFKPANYADGQAGAVYGQNPPIVQPCRKPGEWQTYDIVFHPPLREGERLVDPGSVTVFLNGVLVQDDFPFQGRTTWCRRLPHSEKSEGELRLQDHGHPVLFRNIWIRRIPSRFADTVGGGLGLKRGDVQKLRHELALQSLDFAGQTDDPCERYIRLWESFCYEPSEKVRRLIDPATEALLSAIEAKDGRAVGERRIGPLTRFVKMLVRERFLPEDAAILMKLKAASPAAKPRPANLRDI